MTANQIAYQANLERERSNRANEAIAMRTNVEKERSNRANESISSRQAGASEKQAAASLTKARVAELEYQLKQTKNEADIQKIKAEIDRLNHQNMTDSINAVTGGMANIGKAFSGILG